MVKRGYVVILLVFLVLLSITFGDIVTLLSPLNNTLVVVGEKFVYNVSQTMNNCSLYINQTGLVMSQNRSDYYYFNDSYYVDGIEANDSTSNGSIPIVDTSICWLSNFRGCPNNNAKYSTEIVRLGSYSIKMSSTSPSSEAYASLYVKNYTFLGSIKLYFYEDIDPDAHSLSFRFTVTNQSGDEVVVENDVYDDILKIYKFKDCIQTIEVKRGEWNEVVIAFNNTNLINTYANGIFCKSATYLGLHRFYIGSSQYPYYIDQLGIYPHGVIDREGEKFMLNITNTSIVTNTVLNFTNVILDNTTSYKWKVECCNNSKCYESETRILNTVIINDNSTPSFYNNVTNITNLYPRYNSSILFNITISDYAIDSYIFSHNNSGIFVNLSVNDISGTSYIALQNVTTNLTRGNILGWQVWANDTAGNINVSDIFTVEIRNTEPVINSLFINDTTMDVGIDINGTCLSHDKDGDALDVDYVWFINSTATIYNESILDGLNLTLNANITLQCNISDGFNNTIQNTSTYTVGDTTAPTVLGAYISPTSGTSTTIYVNCTDNSFIKTGHPNVSITRVTDGLLQINLPMNLVTASQYSRIYAGFTVGNTYNFTFYCRDVNENEAIYADNSVIFTYSGGSVVVTPGGGGGGILLTKKSCNFAPNKYNITFYRGDTVKLLLLTNSETFSLIPTYSIDSTKFEVKGAKNIILGGETVDVPIILKEEVANNITAKLLVSSDTCNDVEVYLHYYASGASKFDISKFFTSLKTSINTYLTSEVNLFDFTIKFYFITIVSAILIISFLSYLNLSMGRRVLIGIILFLFVNILLFYTLSEKTTESISQSTGFLSMLNKDFTNIGNNNIKVWHISLFATIVFGLLLMAFGAISRWIKILLTPTFFICLSYVLGVLI